MDGFFGSVNALHPKSKTWCIIIIPGITTSGNLLNASVHELLCNLCNLWFIFCQVSQKIHHGPLTLTCNHKIKTVKGKRIRSNLWAACNADAIR